MPFDVERNVTNLYGAGGTSVPKRDAGMMEEAKVEIFDVRNVEDVSRFSNLATNILQTPCRHMSMSVKDYTNLGTALCNFCQMFERMLLLGIKVGRSWLGRSFNRGGGSPTKILTVYEEGESILVVYLGVQLPRLYRIQHVNFRPQL
ncbi:hypothetical protein XANCAGTX0491_004359 [Xanthoria calcicola]